MTGIRSASFVVVCALAATWSCGSDDSGGSQGGTGGVQSDASADTSSGGSGGHAGSGGGTGGSESDASDAGDAVQSVVKAEDASYSLEQGGQVDQTLGSVSPPDPAYSFVVVSGPSNGELLHVDATTGRFVYTSMTIGDDAFDFEIQKNGQTVDTATITLTTEALDFVGDWHLHPLTSSCVDYDFTVSQVDGGDLSISPLTSACIKNGLGFSLPGGGTTTTTLEPQALGANGCVTDVANLYYCHAFRYWRITSRDDFQSIETLGGSATIGGQQYLISGSVRSIVRRASDTGGSARAALSAKDNPIIIVGNSDGTPKTMTVTLENKGGISANIGQLALPAEATMDGGYPGTGGTCGATLDPGATCTVKLTVTPTQPPSGDAGSVPLNVYFSDAAGFDVTRLTVSWTWQTVADAAAD
jgi:hypothetical protein